MKLQTNKNTYTASNCSLSISDDMKNLDARSYGWWQFVATDKVGNVIFQDTNYSNSTSTHQSNVRSILERLGIKITLRLRHTKEGLESGIKKAIKAEIKYLSSINSELLESTKKKGTHKKKNLDRLAEIKSNEYRISDLKNYSKNYIDKKLIPVDKSDYVDYSELKINHNGGGSWDKYFSKPNGKFKKHEFNEFINRYVDVFRAPTSIDKLTEIFGLKNTEIMPVIAYAYAQDLENQIPSIDTKEYAQLVTWLKKQGIDRKSLNVFKLDKMHVYLTNKLNRKEYVPSEPIKLPLSKKIRSLAGTKNLNIIDTDRALKSEGRRQSHCIGGKDYIEQCMSGYQALNFKGYTFFLDSENNIVQTTGKYNCQTPSKVIDDLVTLLK